MVRTLRRAVEVLAVLACFDRPAVAQRVPPAPQALRAIRDQLTVFHNDASSLQGLARGAPVDFVSVSCDLEAGACLNAPRVAVPANLHACFAPRTRVLDVRALHAVLREVREQRRGNAAHSLSAIVASALPGPQRPLFGWIAVSSRELEPVYAPPRRCHPAGAPCAQAPRLIIGHRLGPPQHARYWLFPDARDTDWNTHDAVPIVGMASLPWGFFVREGTPALLAEAMGMRGFLDRDAALAALHDDTPPEWRFATFAILIVGSARNGQLDDPRMASWIAGAHAAAGALESRLASDADRALLRTTLTSFDALRSGDYLPAQSSCPAR